MSRKLGQFTGICFFVLLYYSVTHTQLDFPLQFSNLPLISEIIDRTLSVIFTASFSEGLILSIKRVYFGFFLAFLTAAPLGIMLARSARAYDFLRPMLEILRPIPNVAWVPIAVILFPKVEWSIYFITFIGAFFPILINSIRGAQSISGKYFRLSAVLKFSKSRELLQVIVPASLPLIFTGSIIGMGTSWLGVIVAESTYGTNGIGYFTFKSMQLIDYPSVIIGMASIGVLGFLSSHLIHILAERCTRWELAEHS